MEPRVLGIHHVTAIAGDPQKNVDFYAGVLGLRLVKKTVNFDDPFTYHLYYGDEVGSPGTILTFFPWTSRAKKGRRGTGQLTVFSFSVPSSGIGFWMERLKKLNVDYQRAFMRFEEEVLVLRDPDGFEIELVATATDNRAPWEGGPVPPAAAIRGFASITVLEKDYEQTADFMTSMLGFNLISETVNRFRLVAGSGDKGAIADISSRPDAEVGLMGVGAVHHVAWRAPDDQTQLALRKKIIDAGYNVTPVIDRNYFHSIYFHEPGNVLFEIATDPPGFSIDESKETLGSNLMLPFWLEQYRREIEENLPPLTVSNPNFPQGK